MNIYKNMIDKKWSRFLSKFLILLENYNFYETKFIVPENLILHT